MFIRAGVVCEQSNDPVGVELAGAAKNAAALAAGATEAQGLNAAGAAAGHIFAEVWRYAEQLGARPESMIGLAGTGDLVATALAPQSRNRRAGELLAQGVPAAEIPARDRPGGRVAGVGPAARPRARRRRRRGARQRRARRLIAGELPLDDWVALVRATVPPPARWRRRSPVGGSAVLERVRGWLGMRELAGPQTAGAPFAVDAAVAEEQPPGDEAPRPAE